MANSFMSNEDLTLSGFSAQPYRATKTPLPQDYNHIQIKNPWTEYYSYFSETAPPKKQDFKQTKARVDPVLSPNMKIKNNLALVQLGRAQQFNEENKYNKVLSGSSKLIDREQKALQIQKQPESKPVVIQNFLTQEKQRFLNSPQGTALKGLLGDPQKTTLTQLFNRVNLNTPQGQELKDFIFG